MTITETFPIPESISFEEAIALTQSFLAEIEQGSLSDSAIEETIAALVASENGARGFFVTYLTDDRSLADQPSNSVIQGLRSSPELVSELLVKNLAMSTAMILTHTRNQNLEMAQGSERVQQRTVRLIQLVKLAIVQPKLQTLLASIATDSGPYKSFLDRWGYDAEQRDAIQQLINRVIT